LVAHLVQLITLGKEPLDLTSYLKNNGPVVFVGYHPDDLDFHCAGLAAWFVSCGIEVAAMPNSA
jgi:hypothetical protein